MKRPQIAKIIRRKYAGINLALDDTIRHFNAGPIHTFRVEVKSLRAFLRLVATIEECRGLKLPRRLHQFYRIIGVIRSLQIQQERINRSLGKPFPVLLKNYLDLIAHQIDNKIVEARKLIEGKRPFKKGMQKLLKILPVKLGRKTIGGFASKTFETLRALIDFFPPSDESLHSIRKSLKDILYTWPFMKEKKTGKIPSSMLFSQEDINLMTKLLGDFQDSCTSLSLLSAVHGNNQISSGESIVLRKLERQWKNEKEVTLKEIFEVLTRLLSIVSLGQRKMVTKKISGKQ